MMIKRSIFLFASILLMSLIITSCEMPKTTAIGEDDEIIVFADDTIWTQLEPLLQHSFEDTIYTPQPELWYRLRREPFASYSEFEKHKNRLVVGLLDGTGPVSKFISSSLAPNARKTVESGDEFVINKYDSHARNQIFMFLVGPNLQSLISSITHRAPDLLYFFKSMTLRRELIAINSESRYHKKEIQDSLKSQYKWSMTIQHDYFVAIDSASERFFWVRRANPADMERWIFVHWIDSADPSKLNEKFVITLRDSLTKKFYRTMEEDAHVEIAPYYLQIEQINFLGRFTYEVRGNWRFNDKTGGGPFVNYTFYDEGSGRIFMLDGSIFAPRVEKKKLITQVDGLLHTFTTTTEQKGLGKK